MENVNEFNSFIQGLIDANGAQIFGKRIHWKNIPEKIAANASKGLNIPGNESMMMLIDASIMGSGKEGMALTNWGIRYKEDANAWGLAWGDFSEKYSIIIKADSLLLQAKPGDDFAVNKEVKMTLAFVNYDILARVLSKSCQIFTGKNVETVNTNASNAAIQSPAVPIQPELTRAPSKAPELPSNFQEAQKEAPRIQDTREEEPYNLQNNRRSNMSDSNSFLKSNIGAIILTLIFSIFICVANTIPFGIILAFPLSFVGYIIGNKLRLLVHPDFVIASGFMGLLKEKFFWRFGPQLVGSLIGALLGAGIIGAIFG
jgi:hypothetical protein